MSPSLEHNPDSLAMDSAVGSASGKSLIAQAKDYARVYQSYGDMTVIVQSGILEGPPVGPVTAQVDEDAVFVGRSEQIRELLLAFGTRPDFGAVVVSAGMGGVGKTALVTRAAVLAVERCLFITAVVLNLNGYDIDATQRVHPRDVLGSLLQALGLPDEQIPATVPGQLTAYRALLEEWGREGRRLLLVLDNAGDADQVAGLLPPGPHVAVVTSRDTLTLPGRTHYLDLDTLPVTDAVDLLTQLMRRADSEDPRAGEGAALVRLADLCGCLPLALEIAAAVIADDSSMTVADFADELEQAPHALESLRRADRSVAAVLDLSWSRLAECDPEAAALLSLLTVNPGPDLSSAAAAVLAGMSESRVKPRLRVLRHAHLLKHAAGRWRMHDLVQLHARAHLDDQHRHLAVQRLLEHYERTARSADAHLQALPGIPVPERFSGRAEALAWFDTERANLTAAVSLTLKTGHLDVTTRLAVYLCEYLSWRRHFTAWVTVSENALIAAQHFGVSRALASAWTNLGIALAQVGRFDDAIAACHQAADISREIGDRRNEATTLNSLGIMLREVRWFDDAISACRQAADISREIDDRRLEGAALHSYACALQGTGRFDEAITACRQAAGIFREIGDRRKEATTLNSLGILLQNVGLFDDATTACHQAADISREIGDRGNEASALNNLGNALRQLRRFNDSITAHRQATGIYRQIGDRRGEADALNDLGNALQQVGRFDDAITAHKQATDISRECGDRHGEAEALNSLGIAFRDSGRLVEARDSGCKAVAAFRETGDPRSQAEVTEWLGTLP